MRAFMHYLIQFTWGIVQNLIGLIMFVAIGLIGRGYFGRYRRAFIVRTRKIYGVSLGVFVFVSEPDNIELIRHEYGHTIQSLILGVLWLPIIGLPSLVWAGFFGKYRRKNNVDYYSFYTERWADKLSSRDYEKSRQSNAGQLQ